MLLLRAKKFSFGIHKKQSESIIYVETLNELILASLCARSKKEFETEKRIVDLLIRVVTLRRNSKKKLVCCTWSSMGGEGKGENECSIGL